MDHLQASYLNDVSKDKCSPYTHSVPLQNVGEDESVDHSTSGTETGTASPAEFAVSSDDALGDIKEQCAMVFNTDLTSSSAASEEILLPNENEELPSSELDTTVDNPPCIVTYALDSAGLIPIVLDNPEPNYEYFIWEDALEALLQNDQTMMEVDVADNQVQD